MAGIYIHIPFCKQACNYCDFHFSTLLKNRTAVVDAIAREIELRKEYLNTTLLQSIYFGGGTPSLLNEIELNTLLDVVTRNFSLEKNAEITLESNPDDISAVKLREWKKAGINRLSIGLQSFNDEELKWMNRAHTAAESINSVKMAQDSGFENITIDLIYGSKFQTLKSWEKTLDTVTRLNTPHISSYNLTIENKTVLGTKFTRGQEPQVNDEFSSAQFIMMLKILEANGFIQYEISNFAKESFFAVHNSNYWLGRQYLGVGPSAHSYNGITRQWNIKNNSLYVQQLLKGGDFFETESLTVKDKYNEYVMTRLRTVWGCNINEMQKLFGKELTNYFQKEMQSKEEFLEIKEGIYTLNQKGKLHADGIASDVFAV